MTDLLVDPEYAIPRGYEIRIQRKLHLDIARSIPSPVDLRREEVHAIPRIVARDPALVAFAIQLARRAIDGPPEINRVYARANEHERHDDPEPQATDHGLDSLNTDHGPNVAARW